jgi:hypothetical protein
VRHLLIWFAYYSLISETQNTFLIWFTDYMLSSQARNDLAI